MGLDAGVAVVDGEVEGHHAVASDGILLGIGGSVGAGGIGDAVPRVAVANGMGLCAGVAMVYGQVQRHHAVAPGGILHQIGRRGGTGGVGVAVPRVAVAGGYVFDTCRAIVDGQVQRHHAVAPCGVGLDECGCRGVGGVGLTMPRVAVAGCLGLHTGVAVVDGKIKGIDIGARRPRLTVVVGVYTRRVIRHAVPSISIASGNGIGGVVVRADGKMQRVGTAAPMCICIFIGIDTARGVGDAVPGIVLAGILIEHIVSARVDHQHQVHQTIASGGVLL